MDLLINVVNTVLQYLKYDWLILLIGILIATSVIVFIKPITFEQYLSKRKNVPIFGSIAFGTLTPLCACGTTAVLLSMFAATLPWGAVMAFLVSSPLTSPSEFLFQSSFMNTNFAIAVLLSSVVLGLIAGIVASYLSRNTSFFKDQFRQKKSSCGSTCGSKSEDEVKVTPVEKQRNLWKEFIITFYNVGIKRVLFLFIIFIALGALIQSFIPDRLILSLFGSDSKMSIIFGALIGLPLYVSGPSALPLMKSFMEQGASEAMLLTFLITGKATGVPVIVGLSAIIKKRALMFYVSFVFIGGIVSGYVYQGLIEFL